MKELRMNGTSEKCGACGQESRKCYAAGHNYEQGHEAEVREFAAQYPTANTARMIALCEAGTITWAQADRIATRALAAGLEAVKR
jgi:hypothetical protein